MKRHELIRDAAKCPLMSRYGWAIAIALVLVIATYIFETYRLVAMEESFIFLYDWDYICRVLFSIGGLAQLIASFLTQFMLFPALAPLLVGIVYFLIIWLLSGLGKSQSPLFRCVVAAVPCMLLWLCVDNSAYKFQGHIAYLLVSALLLVYSTIRRARFVLGVIICVAAYCAAGTAAEFLAVAMCVLDFAKDWRKGALSLAYLPVVGLMAYMAYFFGWVPTVHDAFTPGMYYDMGATYYIMLYALCMLPVVAGVLSAIAGACRWPISAVLAVGAFAVGAFIFTHIHSKANYEIMQMRHYARTDQWSKIIDMPYNGGSTPFTSYRFLALAKEGRLADQIACYRPFILYYLQNKSVVRKEDQQVYSDIYYACDYMSAARHSAFDTNIVTMGEFNPYETLKLAEIAVVYGNYAVAEKLLGSLGKTLFYKDEADALRRFLYDDAAVEADPVLSRKRMVIPAKNDYMSPKGTLRDLKYISDTNPDQTVARQFYEAFLILINGMQ